MRAGVFFLSIVLYEQSDDIVLKLFSFYEHSKVLFYFSICYYIDINAKTIIDQKINLAPILVYCSTFLKLYCMSCMSSLLKIGFTIL